jgi:hypothetical protein
MPAGYDAEVAELFRDLRSASGLTEADLAAQLATRPEVVQALEQGALYALPPWPETYRVVATYGTLLNLDVRPLLRRIYAQVDAGVVGLEPKSMPDVPFMTPPENLERDYEAQPPQADTPAPEPFPVQPRQPAPPQQMAPQASPDRRVAPRPQSPQGPQMRTQAQPQGQPFPQQPQQQPPPTQWPPQQRGMPPAPSRTPPQPPPLPRSGQAAPPREARAPAGSLQPQGRAAVAPRGTSVPLEEKPAKKAWPWNALVKWGVVALVIVGVAAGLWMWLAGPGLLGTSDQAPGKPGAKSSNKGAPTDPNDPRSRKADRLPGPS